MSSRWDTIASPDVDGSALAKVLMMVYGIVIVNVIVMCFFVAAICVCKKRPWALPCDSSPAVSSAPPSLPADATADLFRKELFNVVLSAVDSLVAAVLRGQAIRVAIADLVDRILKKPQLQGSISNVVQSVLRDPALRAEIEQVVHSVLRQNGVVRGDISAIVREVLTTGQLEATIGKVVGNVLTEDKVASGILGAIKGTSSTALRDATDMALDLADQKLPSAIAQAARRRLTAGSDEDLQARLTMGTEVD